MKDKLKPYMIIILILCILVGIYFLWPFITDESDSVLAEGAIDGNSSISNVAEISNKPIAYITEDKKLLLEKVKEIQEKKEGD